MYTNAIKDCLHNLSISENDNKNLSESQMSFYRGLIIGLMSALRYEGHSFNAALRIIHASMPSASVNVNNVLPLAWIHNWKQLED